jgi:dTDP-glucose pyrophosphorylase/CBS domain-containing protein
MSIDTPILLEKFLLPLNTTVHEAMTCIDRNAEGIALVVDEQCRLLGTVTDGDIRRAILADMDLDTPIQVLLARLPQSSHPTPLTAPLGVPDVELLRLMNAHTLRHIPLVDENGRVVDVALLSELAREYELPLSAVVMAGGYGKRLRPLTEELPKPMLPVGDRPLLELIIEQLYQAGIRRVNLTTHYKGEMIVHHFGDGSDFGVEIHYVKEQEPLGTAGALGLLQVADEPLLVMNGDILTRIDFRAMLDFHRQHQADITVGVRQHEFHLPYGVIEVCGHAITGISEKPTLRHLVNAGIYLMNPDVCHVIPNGQPYDMTDLIGSLLAQKRRVLSFPVCEYWQDIGQVEDYRKAITAVTSGEI